MLLVKKGEVITANRKYWTVAVVVSVAALASPATALAQPSAAKGSPGQPIVGSVDRAIPGQFIITVGPGHSPESVLTSVRASATFIYRHALNGFAARLTDAQVNVLQHRSDVIGIERDQIASTDGGIEHTDSSGQPWGLDRMDQRYRPESGSYSWGGTGAGVRAYVIDTGIATADGDFQGRAANVYDAFGGNGQDCNGHGSHVAGTIGGYYWGVAKSALLRGVRVLDCNGTGATSGVIAGIDWVRVNAVHPAVANMSLGSEYSPAENNATYNLAQSGVFVGVAAGNGAADACSKSPASAPGTVTAASSNYSDNRAQSSNYGACVDLYAPGVYIKSDWLGGTFNVISGTSMASPHVTGTAALFKGDYGDWDWQTIASWITGSATTNVIGNNVTGTVNRLLFKSGL
jgi:subtilisin family serine protease